MRKAGIVAARRGARPASARPRSPRLVRAIVGGLALLGVVAAAIALWGARPGRSAVIVDQLSLTAPNEEFRRQATSLLQAAGYGVDYFAGTNVTVRFIQSLPARGDELILLRMHSARIVASGSQTDDVALFTGETIDLSRSGVAGLPDGAATAVAQAKERAPSAPARAPEDPFTHEEQAGLIPVVYDDDAVAMPLYGLRPSFVERSLTGNLKDSATVVLMGCDGLRSADMARAFVARGAGTFVSWDMPVSAPHTDAATLRLLELLATEGLPPAEAVARTMAEMGPDPMYKGRMVAYP